MNEMNLEIQANHLSGMVDLDGWEKTLVDGAVRCLKEDKVVKPVIMVLAVNPQHKNDTIIHSVPMTQLPGTEAIPHAIKAVIKNVDAYAYATISEAWTTPSKIGDDYKRGDIAKRNDREETVMITIESKLTKRLIMIPILRYENGNPYLNMEKMTKAENAGVEGRVSNLLYDADAAKKLN